MMFQFLVNVTTLLFWVPLKYQIYSRFYKVDMFYMKYYAHDINVSCIVWCLIGLIDLFPSRSFICTYLTV